MHIREIEGRQLAKADWRQKRYEILIGFYTRAGALQERIASAEIRISLVNIIDVLRIPDRPSEPITDQDMARFKAEMQAFMTVVRNAEQALQSASEAIDASRIILLEVRSSLDALRVSVNELEFFASPTLLAEGMAWLDALTNAIPYRSGVGKEVAFRAALAQANHHREAYRNRVKEELGTALSLSEPSEDSVRSNPTLT